MAVDKKRNTMQKRYIYDCLKDNADRHITVDELCEELKSRGIKIGQATVYRYLKEIESTGELKRFSLGDSNCACYQLSDGKQCSEHCHIICTECGRLEHIKAGILTNVSKEVKANTGFTVNEGRTVFYGICKSCSAIN